MSDTRPASNDPRDIARWEHEREQEVQRLRDEREFREQMRGFVGRADTTLQHIKDSQDAHSAEDRAQFAALHKRCDEIESKVGANSQSIDGHSSKFNIIWAVAGAAVTIVTVVWMLVKG